MINPPVDGAVAVMVNAAAPGAAPESSAADSVTVHVRVAAARLRLVQLTLDTPVPTLVAVAVTPAGSVSAMVADVPLGEPPSLPRLIMYVMVPPMLTEPVALLLRVRFEVAGVADVLAIADDSVVVPSLKAMIASDWPLMKYCSLAVSGAAEVTVA